MRIGIGSGVVLASLLLVGCASQNQPTTSTTANAPGRDSTEAADTPQEPSLADRLASNVRPLADRERDAGRKPVLVMEFLGIKPGMQVLDLLAYSGYYSEVLANAVGPGGKVYSQNPSRVLELSNGANDKALNQRLRNNRLPNVQRVDREFNDLGIAPGSLDAALTAINLHDLYHESPAHAKEVLGYIRNTLKPGGTFGVIDHIGVPGRDNVRLHRMTKAQAIELAESAGFELIAKSDVLANPYDDHTLFVFGPELRGITDRFLLKLRKP